uniref:Ig-like domain-containing protein n=1 Tax=Oncorhynchus mykiss TaxID=8022 RepID=A0A8C7NQY1_ONCMY
MVLMVTAEGLKVRQWPPSLTVMRGQSANLSCRFEATSYGVDWFKIEGAEKIPIPDSAGQTSLVITEVSVEDAGVYYCEVNVLHRDSERGGGTKLIVLGKTEANYLVYDSIDPVTERLLL